MELLGVVRKTCPKIDFADGSQFPVSVDQVFSLLELLMDKRVSG